MKKMKIKNMVLAAMFLGIGLLLPFLTGQIKQLGNMLLPMHIPVLLCGLICGWQYGLIIGFILPLLRSFLFAMPVMYPNAAAMAFELAVYGFVSGWLYSRSLEKSVKALYGSMVSAMVLGRIVWGIVKNLLMGFSGFSFKVFLAGAIINAIPGIILQLIIIPVIMLALKRAKLISHDKGKNNYIA